MKLTIPLPQAGRLKQLTWVAGRTSTPQPWMRSVWLNRYGAAATDDFAGAWFPWAGDHLAALSDGWALAPNAQDLRTHIGRVDPTEAGYPLQLGETHKDRNLLRTLVSRGAGVRKHGQRHELNVEAAKRTLQAASKRGAVRWTIGGLKLHVPTTKRVLRQVKTKGGVMVWWTDHLVYLQCPVTGVEFVMSKIHPDIDPD